MKATFTNSDDLEIRRLLADTEREMFPLPPLVEEEEDGGGWLLFGAVVICFFGCMAAGFVTGLWLSRS